MTRRWALALVTLVASAVVSADHATPGVTLPPGHVHEICKPLHTGESWAYNFRADAPLEFNVHYHEGDEVLFPVPVVNTPRAWGTMTARLNQTYCQMWRNLGDTSAQLRLGD